MKYPTFHTWHSFGAFILGTISVKFFLTTWWTGIVCYGIGIFFAWVLTKEVDK